MVHLDAGSTDRLAQQNLQTPEHANNWTLPSWLFDARLSVRDKLTSSHPDYSLKSFKSKPPSYPQLQQAQHAKSHGELRRAHELKAYKREVCLGEVRYCEGFPPCARFPRRPASRRLGACTAAVVAAAA